MTSSGLHPDPLCASDALLGWELDDVLLGDAGAVGIRDASARPYKERHTFLVDRPRRPTDTGWGAWYERELQAYRKRCEKRARRWNAKTRKLREKQEREAAKLAALAYEKCIARKRVPLLRAQVCSSITDWWAMWTLLWIDIGQCMKVLGERGIATNREELIRDGVVTISFTSTLPTCWTCNASSLFLISRHRILPPRCVPCWILLGSP